MLSPEVMIRLALEEKRISQDRLGKYKGDFLTNRKFKNIKLAGLAIHIGSQLQSLSPFEKLLNV